MSKYILFTKFWNERDKILGVVDTVSQQTKPPSAWLLADDGSTDGSGKLFRSLAESLGIPVLLSSLPPKTKGNLDELGNAYQHAFDMYKDQLNEMSPDYLGLLDVDTKLPASYYSRLIAVLDGNPELGCVSGRIRGESFKSTWPRGSGKIVRWRIVNYIDKYWNLDADSFYNIKALRLGYNMRVVKEIKIDAEPSQIFSDSGSYRYGRVNYYERRHPLLVLQRFLLDSIRNRNGVAYLQGYIHEWSKGTWECKDKDVRYFYSLEYRLRRKLIRKFGIGRHKWPR